MVGAYPEISPSQSFGHMQIKSRFSLRISRFSEENLLAIRTAIINKVGTSLSLNGLREENSQIILAIDSFVDDIRTTGSFSISLSRLLSKLNFVQLSSVKGEDVMPDSSDFRMVYCAVLDSIGETPAEFRNFLQRTTEG